MMYTQIVNCVSRWTRLSWPVMAVMVLSFGFFLAGQTPNKSVENAQVPSTLPTMNTPIGATFVFIPSGSFQMRRGSELASSARVH